MLCGLLRPCGLISSRQGTVGAHWTRDSSFSQIQDKFLRHDAAPLPLNALLKEDSQASGEGDNVGSSPALPLTSKGRNEEGSSLPGCSREPGWLDIQAPAVTRHPDLPHTGRTPTRAGREQSRHCPRWAHTSPTPGLVIEEPSQSALSPVQRGENPGPEETSASAPVPALETQTSPETPARPGQCCGVSIEGLQEPNFFFFYNLFCMLYNRLSSLPCWCLGKKTPPHKQVSSNHIPGTSEVWGLLQS